MLIKKTYINPLGIVLLLLLFSCKIEKSPLIKSFTVKPKSIIAGNTAILRWEVKNAKFIKIEGVGDSMPPINEIEVTPDKSLKYKLVVATKNKPLKRLCGLTVHGPSIEFLNCADTATDETVVFIEWKTNNSSYVRLTPIADSLPVAGTYNIIFDTSKVLILKACNKNGVGPEIKHEIKIRKAEYVSGDEVISEGSDALIYWKFDNVKQVKVDGFKDPFNAVDAVQVKPLKTTIYKLEITRNTGKVENREFKVYVLPPGSFYFSCPGVIMKGDEATMWWEIKDADSVKIKGVDKVFKGKGKYSFKPEFKTTYKLSFNYKKEQISFKHTINVIERSFMKGEKTIESLKKGVRMDFDIVSVDRGKYPDEVKLLVAVIDTSGNFISNLAPENNPALSRKYFKQLIEIIESKKYPINDYTVREIKSSSKPFDISLVLDYSGSMSGTPIKNLEKSCKKLIENKNPDDRISVIKFDHNLVQVIPLTKDKNELLRKVNFNEFYKYGGATALYAAGDEGLSTIDTSANNKMMILFTDGYENASFPYYETHSVTAQQLVRNARSNNVKFNIVSYGEGTNEIVLQFMAILSGGKFYNIRNHKHIEQVTSEIPKLTRRYYEITYKPTIAGGFRSIELVYNNNVSPFVSVQTQACMDESYNMVKIEEDVQKAGNSNPVIDTLKNFSRLKPITDLQVIALFDFNKAIILEQYETSLKKYTGYIKQHPKTEVIIIGHTDTKGTVRACLKVSKKRAEEIKRYFVNNGISGNRIKIIACGKSHPLWKEDKNEIQAKENRRVEIIILE